MDWTAEALETDSFSDVVTSAAGEEAFDFDRLQYAAASLAEHLQTSCMARRRTIGRPGPDHRRVLDETGYLGVPLEQIAELTGAPSSIRSIRRWRWCSRLEPAGRWRAQSWRNAWPCRPKPPTATTPRWRG